MTSTTRRVRYAGDRARSTSTGSRPSTSSTCDLAQLHDRSRSPLHELGQARQRLDGQPGGARRLDDLRAHLAGGGRDRDEDLVRPAVAEQPLQVGDRAEDADPVQPHVALARVVVDEADRGVAERRVAEHLLDHELRRIAGADDERLLAACDDLPGPRPLQQCPREEAGARDEGEAEEQVDEPHSRRDAGRVELEEREDDERGEDRERTPREADHMSRVETYLHQRL